MALRFMTGIAAAAAKPVLPETIIAGYTDQTQPEVVLHAVQQGANVLFWSFMELEGNEVSASGVEQGSVTATKVRPVHEGLVKLGRTDVVHMLSIGGWGVTHRFGICGDAACDGKKYAESFQRWNAGIMADIPGFPGFAGLDWDIEGVNEVDASSNEFTAGEMQIMLDASEALKDKFIISMVPPQSYFDCGQPNFDLSLRHEATSTPSFHYHSWNAYAALFAMCPDCFDLVMVQIYEGWSRAGFELYWDGDAANVGAAGFPRNGTEAAMSRVVQQNIRCLVEGFDVDFGGFLGLGKRQVQVPAEKVIIGLGSGEWTRDSNFKAPYFSAEAAGAAWCQGVAGAKARGFAYWSMSYDSDASSYAGDLAVAMKKCTPELLI